MRHILMAMALFACGAPIVAVPAQCPASPDAAMPAASKPGDQCSLEGEGTCESEHAALWCDGGELIRVPCRGPKGCKHAVPESVTCDWSAAIAGDLCPAKAEGAKQCSSTGAKLTCVGGNWTAQECPMDGCILDHDGIMVCK